MLKDCRYDSLNSTVVYTEAYFGNSICTEVIYDGYTQDYSVPDSCRLGLSELSGVLPNDTNQRSVCFKGVPTAAPTYEPTVSMVPSPSPTGAPTDPSQYVSPHPTPVPTIAPPLRLVTNGLIETGFETCAVNMSIYNTASVSAYFSRGFSYGYCDVYANYTTCASDITGSVYSCSPACFKKYLAPSYLCSAFSQMKETCTGSMPSFSEVNVSSLALTQNSCLLAYFETSLYSPESIFLVPVSFQLNGVSAEALATDRASGKIISDVLLSVVAGANSVVVGYEDIQNAVTGEIHVASISSVRVSCRLSLFGDLFGGAVYSSVVSVLVDTMTELFESHVISSLMMSAVEQHVLVDSGSSLALSVDIISQSAAVMAASLSVDASLYGPTLYPTSFPTSFPSFGGIVTPAVPQAVTSVPVAMISGITLGGAAFLGLVSIAVFHLMRRDKIGAWSLLLPKAVDDDDLLMANLAKEDECDGHTYSSTAISSHCANPLKKTERHCEIEINAMLGLSDLVKESPGFTAVSSVESCRTEVDVSKRGQTNKISPVSYHSNANLNRPPSANTKVCQVRPESEVDSESKNETNARRDISFIRPSTVTVTESPRPVSANDENSQRGPFRLGSVLPTAVVDGTTRASEQPWPPHQPVGTVPGPTMPNFVGSSELDRPSTVAGSVIPVSVSMEAVKPSTGNTNRRMSNVKAGAPMSNIVAANRAQSSDSPTGRQRTEQTWKVYSNVPAVKGPEASSSKKSSSRNTIHTINTANYVKKTNYTTSESEEEVDVKIRKARAGLTNPQQSTTSTLHTSDESVSISGFEHSPIIGVVGEAAFDELAEIDMENGSVEVAAISKPGTSRPLTSKTSTRMTAVPDVNAVSYDTVSDLPPTRPVTGGFVNGKVGLTDSLEFESVENVEGLNAADGVQRFQADNADSPHKTADSRFFADPKVKEKDSALNKFLSPSEIVCNKGVSTYTEEDGSVHVIGRRTIVKRELGIQGEGDDDDESVYSDYASNLSEEELELEYSDDGVDDGWGKLQPMNRSGSNNRRKTRRSTRRTNKGPVDTDDAVASALRGRPTTADINNDPAVTSKRSSFTLPNFLKNPFGAEKSRDAHGYVESTTVPTGPSATESEGTQNRSATGSVGSVSDSQAARRGSWFSFGSSTRGALLSDASNGAEDPRPGPTISASKDIVVVSLSSLLEESGNVSASGPVATATNSLTVNQAGLCADAGHLGHATDQPKKVSYMDAVAASNYLTDLSELSSASSLEAGGTVLETVSSTAPKKRNTRNTIRNSTTTTRARTRPVAKKALAANNPKKRVGSGSRSENDSGLSDAELSQSSVSSVQSKIRSQSPRRIERPSENSKNKLKIVKNQRQNNK
jgi:hypothetical protein